MNRRLSDFIAPFVLLAGLCFAAGSWVPGQETETTTDESPSADAAPSHAPAAEDFTAASLRAFRGHLASHYGGYRDVPLDLKAAFFEWQIWNYHQAPTHQVYNRVRLPSEMGHSPVWIPGSD